MMMAMMIVELEMNDVSFQYLYTADGLAFLLNPKTLEEISLPIQLVSGGLAKVMEGGTEVKVRMSQEKPILVHSPQRTLKCTVSEVLERRDGNHRLRFDSSASLIVPHSQVIARVPWCRCRVGRGSAVRG